MWHLRLGAGGLLLALTGFLTWIFVLRSPAPPEAEGQAWLSGFADLLTSARLLGAKGPDVVALFPGLENRAAPGCVTTWSIENRSAPIVIRQRLELGRLGDDACDQAQFGMLTTTLRQSEGVTPGALAKRFTEAFGPPSIYRDTGLNGAINSNWMILDGVDVRLQEQAGPGAAATFEVHFMRYYAAPTTLPDAAESAAWMDSTVELVTGPDLAHARGPAAAALVGVPMQAVPSVDGGCTTDYRSDLLRKGPIGSGQSLYLEHAEGMPCNDAAFASLSMSVWRYGPVTAEALVGRLSAKLGSPVVTRAFDRDDIEYQWRTRQGTTVELSEGLTGDLRHWMRLRTSKYEN